MAGRDQLFVHTSSGVLSVVFSVGLVVIALQFFPGQLAAFFLLWAVFFFFARRSLATGLVKLTKLTRRS